VYPQFALLSSHPNLVQNSCEIPEDVRAHNVIDLVVATVAAAIVLPKLVLGEEAPSYFDRAHSS
jgi:hypothetical protein